MIIHVGRNINQKKGVLGTRDSMEGFLKGKTKFHKEGEH